MGILLPILLIIIIILLLKPELAILLLNSLKQNFKLLKENLKEIKSNLNVKNFIINGAVKSEKISGKIDSKNNAKISTKIITEIEPKIDVEIYFGSQTGTAESFAFSLNSEIKSFGIKSKVIDLEDFDTKKFLNQKSKTAIFVLATYGEGDPTENAETFWQFLSDENDKDFVDPPFSNFNFAIFGLGNSQYEFYNAMGKKTFKMLCALGANPICGLGLGNDDDDIENDFENWKPTVLKSLQKIFPGRKPINFSSNKFVNKTRCVYLTEEQISEFNSNINFIPIDADKKYISSIATVVKNEIISSDGLKYHAEFDISQCELIKGYYAGQTLCISPRNNYKLVAKICSALKFDKKKFFYLISANSDPLHKEKKIFENPKTIEEALLWYVDLTNIPRANFLEIIAGCLTDIEEQNFFQKFVHFDLNRKREYFKTKYKTNFSILSVLTNLKSLEINFETLIESLPRLIPREYTISSSSLKCSDIVSITYSLVGVKNDISGMGVCTKYLANLKSGKDKVAIFLKESTLKLPSNIFSPVIMIAAGTGIAPFRGFLYEAKYTKIDEKGENCIENEEKNNKKWCLIFGCKTAENDFLYKDEIQSCLKSEKHPLKNLITAFSRSQKEKFYVQDAIRKNSEILWNFLKQPDLIIFVCGPAKMGSEVKKAISDVFAKKISTMEKDEAKKWRKHFFRIQAEKRFICELWG